MIRDNKYWNLVKNAGVYVSGNIVQKITLFLLTPLWANFLLPEDYGITGTLAAYEQVLVVLFGMGLGSAIIRFYFDHEENPEKLKCYLSSNFIVLLIAPAVFMLFMSLFGKDLWNRSISNNISFFPYALLQIWTVYFMIIVQTWGRFLRARQKAKQFVFVNYGVFILYVVFGLLFVVILKLGALGALLQKFIPYLIMFILVLIWFFKDWFSFSINWKFVWESMLYGFPLIIHSLSLWGLNASSRVILDRFVSLAELGLYNFGYSIGMGLGAITTGINQAWMPYYFSIMKKREKPDSLIRKIVSAWFVLIGGLTVASVLFISEFMVLFLPSSYLGSLKFVYPLLFGSFLHGSYFFASMALFYFRKTRLIPIVTGIIAVINIAVNFLLIPMFGAIASAWISVMAEIVLVVIFYLVSRRYHQINYPLKSYLLLMLVIFLVVLLIPNFKVATFSGSIIKLLLLFGYLLLSYQLLISRYIKKNIFAWGRSIFNQIRE